MDFRFLLVDSRFILVDPGFLLVDPELLVILLASFTQGNRLVELKRKHTFQSHPIEVK